ncbi:glutaredoxin family protein, partial [Neisseria sp. P0015.S009]
MKLTLMFREYCSLCHKMREQLNPYQEQFGFE